MVCEEKIFNLWRKVSLLSFKAFKFRQEIHPLKSTIKPGAIGPNISRNMIERALSWGRHFTYGAKAKIIACMSQIGKS